MEKNMNEYSDLLNTNRREDIPKSSQTSVQTLLSHPIPTVWKHRVRTDTESSLTKPDCMHRTVLHTLISTWVFTEFLLGENHSTVYTHLNTNTYGSLCPSVSFSLQLSLSAPYPLTTDRLFSIKGCPESDLISAQGNSLRFTKTNNNVVPKRNKASSILAPHLPATRHPTPRRQTQSD